MAAAKDYLPTKDAQFLAWTATFAAGIADDPSAYGLDVTITNNYTVKQAAFAAALAVATEPATRGTRTVYLKRDARKNLAALTRQIAKQVNGMMSVTDAQRQLLGLPIPSGHRTPSQPPTVAPVLFATKTDGRTVTLEMRQSKTRRGRPEGVATLMVFTASTPVGETAPAVGDPAWQFALSTTLTSVPIPCGTSATGDTVHFVAFYCNAKAESGPAAKPISVALPAGGVLPQQVQQMKLRAA